jgi:starch phosphorylase
MEIGLEPDMPTYSGGLGILAGDTIRSAADMEVPMVAVTLLPRRGYFRQTLDEAGDQMERPERWNVAGRLKRLKASVALPLKGREVTIRAWQYDAVGVTGATVPVLFLDTDLPVNAPEDRELSWHLYGGDACYRLCQEYVLGVGGVRMLRALGYRQLDRFHMNEGHAAFLTLELLDEQLGHKDGKKLKAAQLKAVRDQCVFTTHTPVAAGHDKFPMPMVREVIGRHPVWSLRKEICDAPDTLNMTYLALKFSRYINGVSAQHGQTSREMFGGYRIDAITNGVHAATWAAPPFQRLLDRHIPAWRTDNSSLRYALTVPEEQVWAAHTHCKARLIRHINKTQDTVFDPAVFTIGFARRATAYKRADLVLHSVSRLKKIAATAGALQIVFAGKAHPRDEPGKALIRQIFKAGRRLAPEVRIVYLPNYDIALAKVLIPGVDLWLNTPQPPHEASGTSGMKAALNAVPSLSILDGWWTEGCVESLTGWAIDKRGKQRKSSKSASAATHAKTLYDKLEKVILPMYYRDRSGYVRVMTAALALNGSFFNTQRMVREYLLKAYMR